MIEKINQLNQRVMNLGAKLEALSSKVLESSQDGYQFLRAGLGENDVQLYRKAWFTTNNFNECELATSDELYVKTAAGTYVIKP